MKPAVFRLIALLLLAYCIGLLLNRLTGSRIPLLRSTQRYLRKDEITPEKAILIHRFNSGVFLDARPIESFAQAHIRGALPAYPTAKNIQKLISQLDKRQLFVAYCDHLGCSLARILAQKLGEAGFENIFVLRGGINSWTLNGYPTE
jgi:rhodanese-related sulfurtransferase